MANQMSSAVFSKATASYTANESYEKCYCTADHTLKVRGTQIKINWYYIEYKDEQEFATYATADLKLRSANNIGPCHLHF
jgi:hypothetical protein